MIDPSLQSTIMNLIKYAQKVEMIARFKDREIERLEYLNKYLVIAQEKRDEMLKRTLEENRRLKESILKGHKTKNDKNIIRNGSSKHMQSSQQGASNFGAEENSQIGFN